jgi:hypothetical protein
MGVDTRVEAAATDGSRGGARELNGELVGERSWGQWTCQRGGYPWTRPGVFARGRPHGLDSRPRGDESYG